MLWCSPEADRSSAITSRRDKKLFAEVTIKTSRKRPETGCQESLAPRVEHKVIFPKNPIESDNRELMTQNCLLVRSGFFLLIIYLQNMQKSHYDYNVQGIFGKDRRNCITLRRVPGAREHKRRHACHAHQEPIYSFIVFILYTLKVKPRLTTRDSWFKACKQALH